MLEWLDSATTNVSVNKALCSGQFAMSIMQTMFMFYYVRVFRMIFEIDNYWFGVAQVVFLLWNSFNDPFFGVVQDLSNTWLSNRRKVILYLGPFVCASFLLLWFPWTRASSRPYVTGAHLICALFFYDAFYSCVNVAWSALFSESTYDHNARVTAIKYSQLAILASVNIIPITEKISHSTENFFVFQCTCTVVAILATICFYIAGNMQATENEIPLQTNLLPSNEMAKTSKEKIPLAIRMAKDVITRRDFILLVATNFIHNCRSVSHLNFAAIATETLIPQEVLADGSWSKSLFFAACTLLPQVLIILSGKFITRRGAYKVIMKSFVASVVMAILFWMVAFGRPLHMMLFMFIDSVMVHSIAPLFQILIAEFVDDDARRHSRSKPISSLIFSLNALLVKPAQSVTPVFVLLFLDLDTNSSQIMGDVGFKSTKVYDESSMWSIVCLFPLFLGAIEFLLLRMYRLKDSHQKGKIARNF